MNYYPFHVGDYAAHTAHLEPLEDLAYRRMLDLYYLRECALPQDAAEIARLIRMRGNVVEVEAVLREFFTSDGDGWAHARCDAELVRMQDRQAKARASAKASVDARLAKHAGERSTNAQRTLNERSADVELPTPTPSTSEANASGGKPPAADSKPQAAPDPRRELYEAGKSLLAEQGMPKAQTGSFITKLAKDYGQDVALEAVRSAVSNRPLEAAAYLKATCQRLKGERRDQVTVESNAAAQTAEYLRQQAERASQSTGPPPEVLEKLRGLKRVA